MAGRPIAVWSLMPFRGRTALTDRPGALVVHGDFRVSFDRKALLFDLVRSVLLAFVVSLFPFGVGAAVTTAKTCAVGAYASPDGEVAALIASAHVGRVADAFVLEDGEFGDLDEADAKLTCVDGAVRERASHRSWQRVALVETPIEFASVGVVLSGLLVEPAGTGRRRPLLVFVQGSEKWSHVAGAYQYLLAAQGVAFFTWDKRGTNHSGGTFTDDFGLLAKDTSAALSAVRGRAAGRFSRVGLLGGSQGGWVAPLASLRSPVDYLIIAFGVAGSPIEQDRWQVRHQLHLQGVSTRHDAAIDRLTSATAEVVRSGGARGSRRLAELAARERGSPWLARVDGQFSGQVLAGDLAGVKADNPGLSWDYDALRVLRAVRVPQHWIMADDDSVAPSVPSIERLRGLQDQGHRITVTRFADADHGMHTFRRTPNGLHAVGLGYVPGYMDLIARIARDSTTGGGPRSGKNCDDVAPRGSAVGRDRPSSAPQLHHGARRRRDRASSAAPLSRMRARV